MWEIVLTVRVVADPDDVDRVQPVPDQGLDHVLNVVAHVGRRGVHRGMLLTCAKKKGMCCVIRSFRKRFIYHILLYYIWLYTYAIRFLKFVYS